MGWGSGWTLEGGQEIQQRGVSMCVWRTGEEAKWLEQLAEVLSEGRWEVGLGPLEEGAELWPKS